MRIIFNLSNSGERRRNFRETMALEKIAQSPVSAMPFPGYENVRLTHRQLAAAVNNEEWRATLGSVQAVYLQTDRRTGWHYVGSAYSRKGATHGLLSRWEEYASGDHSGGNKQLRKLGAGYIEDNFQYSILEIFDMHKPAKEIIDREHWWMDTLGSVRRDDDVVPHGYNSVAERDNDDQCECPCSGCSSAIDGIRKGTAASPFLQAGSSTRGVHGPHALHAAGPVAHSAVRMRNPHHTSDNPTG